LPGEIVGTTTQQNRRAFILIYHYIAALLGSPFGTNNPNFQPFGHFFKPPSNLYQTIPKTTQNPLFLRIAAKCL
jgi:hypothetical protein